MSGTNLSVGLHFGDEARFADYAFDDQPPILTVTSLSDDDHYTSLLIQPRSAAAARKFAEAAARIADAAEAHEVRLLVEAVAS